VNERKYSVATVGSKIDEFLDPVLEQAGFELDYEIADVESTEADFETPDVVVKFSGEDVDLLLGNRAELLLALEHLTMEALRMPSEDHSRISFDANDYRLLRIEELRMSAIAAAEKVKSTGQPFRFNPMNSRERRVIHLALRNETELRSESLGTGGQRMVVVYPAGMASLPEPPPMAMRPSGGGRRDGGGFRSGGGPPRGGRDGDRGRGRDRGGRGGGGGRDRGRSGPPRGNR
jgi:spoIIIJ-associated protein